MYISIWRLALGLVFELLLLEHRADAADSCAGAKFTAFVNGNYNIGDKSMPWLNAYKCCIEKNLTLMSLETREETLSLAAELAKKIPKAKLWTSAQLVAGIHIWSSNGKPLQNYTSWAPGQPNHRNRVESPEECVIAEPSGIDNILWSDEACTASFQVACEKKHKGSGKPINHPPKGGVIKTFEGVDYIFANGKYSWIAGTRYCREQNGQLVVLEREDKFTFLAKTWKAHKPSDGFWTSGTEIGRSDKKFFWASTGKDLGSFHKFDVLPIPKLNHKNCLLVQPDGKWIDEICSTMNGIICEPHSGCRGM